MEGNSLHEPLYVLLDAVMFIFAITTVLFIVRGITTATFKVAKEERSNTTITDVADESANYVGYSRYGKDLYDGTLEGSVVVTDILQMDGSIPVYINGSDVTSLLETAKNENDSVIRGRVITARKYQRRYELDNNGKIIGVNYILF